MTLIRASYDLSGVEHAWPFAFGGDENLLEMIFD